MAFDFENDRGRGQSAFQGSKVVFENESGCFGFESGLTGYNRESARG